MNKSIEELRLGYTERDRLYHMNRLANERMRFGKFKGVFFSQVPIFYLEWLYDKATINGKLKQYVYYKLNKPMPYFTVRVDGVKEYEVRAFNSSHAISRAQKQYNIRCSQSGTIFRAIRH